MRLGVDFSYTRTNKREENVLSSVLLYLNASSQSFRSVYDMKLILESSICFAMSLWCGAHHRICTTLRDVHIVAGLSM